MKELVISKAGVQCVALGTSKCFSFGGSANQIDRLAGLEGLNGRLFS